MLNLITSTCLIAISTGPLDWSRSVVIKHETGHCVCPDWHHGRHETSAINPPKQCQGEFKGQKIIYWYSEKEANKICHGSDACVVDIW